MIRAEKESAALVGEDGASIRRSGVDPVSNVADSGAERKARIMEAAEAFTRNGVPVVPVTVVSGDRKPTVKGFNEWGRDGRRLPSWGAIRDKFEREVMPLIGVLTGERSGLTLVDVDSTDPDVLREVVARFGNTPLVVRTGSGKWHLWFRWNGERNRNLRGVLGLPVDIRGEGGLGIAPSSIHHETNRPYALHAGNLSMFWSGDLPVIEDGAIPDRAPAAAADPYRHPSAGPGDLVPVGGRHNALLGLLRQACWKHDNEKLAAHEAWSVVQSTFARLDDGEYTFDKIMARTPRVLEWCRANPRRSEPFAMLQASEAVELMDAGKALALLTMLRARFLGRAVEFPASPAWLASEYGGIARTWRAARNELIARGFIVLRKKGGRGKNDPDQYGWGARSLAVLRGHRKGITMIPNTYNITRPPMDEHHSATAMVGAAAKGRDETDTASAMPAASAGRAA